MIRVEVYVWQLNLCWDKVDGFTAFADKNGGGLGFYVDTRGMGDGPPCREYEVAVPTSWEREKAA